MIRLTCTNCQKTLRAPPEWAGRSTKCPGCGTPVTIPAPVATPAPVAVPAPAAVTPPVPEPAQTEAKPPRTRRWITVAAFALCGILLLFVVKAIRDINANLARHGENFRDQSERGQKRFEEMVRGITVPERKKEWTRDEFKKLVMGKAKADIIKIVGRRPDRTSGDEAVELWHYDGVSHDPVADRPDRVAQIVIEKGVVTGVNFY